MRFSVLGAIGIALAAGCNSGSFGSRGDEPIVPPPSPRPTFGATTTLEKAPPSISGGTLLVTADGATAVAADPDRDRVVLANLSTGATIALALSPNDEPGRIVESDPGRVHVVLRGGGAVVTIDLRTGSIVGRHAVCPAPRGIAHSAGRLFVACAGGEFVSLSKETGEVLFQKNLGRDLRDVVAVGGLLKVSRFRSAEVITVNSAGDPTATLRAPAMPLITSKGEATSGVAWRLFPIFSNRMLMIHQRARDPNAEPIPTQPGGYSDSRDSTTKDPSRPRCGLGIVHAAMTNFDEFGGAFGTLPLSDAVLPVDAALHHSGEVAVVAAGNGHTPELGSVLRYPVLSPKATSSLECLTPTSRISPNGQPIAAAYASDVLVVQTREPSRLVRYALDNTVLSTIELGGNSVEDTGHAIFHSNAGGFMACASCHPEGGDDGHVWAFADLGPRRTQNLRGGISGTEPFHWNGELHDLTALTGEVFARRMSGETLSADRVQALAHWIDAIPYLPATVGDADKIARGKALFDDSAVGCATCHTGPRLTNNTSHDVGTGGVFQVPSLLGVAHRAPFMHTGCAPTLADRFSGCGGDSRHGKITHLGAEQRADLVAYLESL